MIGEDQFIRLVDIKVWIEIENLFRISLTGTLEWTSYLDYSDINSWLNNFKTGFIGSRASSGFFILFKKLFICDIMLW